MSSLYQKFFSSFFGHVVGSLSIKVFSAGCVFLFNLVVARYLGVEQAGYFFLAQAIIVVLSNVSRLGFDNAVIRFIASYKVTDDYASISSLSFFSIIIVSIFSLLSTILLYLLSEFISVEFFSKPELTLVLKISSLCILPLAISQLIGFCFQGKKKIKIAMLYQAAFLTFVSLLAFYFFPFVDAASGFLLYLSCSLFVAIVSIIHWLKDINVFKFFYPKHERDIFLKTIKPLFFILFMTQITQWSGQVILGVWSSPSEIALFSASLRTAMLISFVLAAVNAITAPRFAEAYKKKDFESIKKIAMTSSKVMTLFSIPMALVVFLFPARIMSLFGSDFSVGGNILIVLSIGQLVNVITGAVGVLLQMTGNEKSLQNNMLLSCLLLIFLSILLVPKYGALGAAISTSIAISIQNVMCVRDVKKILGFNMFKFL